MVLNYTLTYSLWQLAERLRPMAFLFKEWTRVSIPPKRVVFAPKGVGQIWKRSRMSDKRGPVTGQQWHHNVHAKSVDAWNFGSNVSELGYRKASCALEQKGHNQKFGPEKGYDFSRTKSTKRDYFSNSCTDMLTQMVHGGSGCLLVGAHWLSMRLSVVYFS